MDGFQRRRRKIGLLGGSFNPAHEGHMDISRQALAVCDLDEIWWLVSPQNPLKPRQGMASFSSRVESARLRIGFHPKIRVKAIESEIGTSYTAETITYLIKHYRDCSFLWIMGADNLSQIHTWKDWHVIFRAVPIVIFDRPGYTYSALKAKAARLFASSRRWEQSSKMLVREKAPAWLFLHGRLNPISASGIRASQVKNP